MLIGLAAVFGDQLIQRGREKELLARGEEYEKQMGLPKGEGWKDVQLQCEYALDEYYMRTEKIMVGLVIDLIQKIG